MALSLGYPVSVHRGSNPCVPGIQSRWLLDFEVFPESFRVVGRPACVAGGLSDNPSFHPFLVIDRLRVVSVNVHSHSAVTPMTMGDSFSFSVFWRQHGKLLSFLLW